MVVNKFIISQNISLDIKCSIIVILIKWSSYLSTIIHRHGWNLWSYDSLKQVLVYGHQIETKWTEDYSTKFQIFFSVIMKNRALFELKCHQRSEISSPLGTFLVV